MKRCILVLVLILLAGCGRESTGKWFPAGSNVPTAAHKKAVEAARNHLAVSSPTQRDSEYRVEVSGGDYWVYLDFISGYRAFGEPMKTPGAHCVIVVTPDYSVKAVFQGS